MQLKISGTRGKQQGQALAELAIVVGLVFMLALSAFELGRGFFAYMAVVHAARDGARVAMDASKTDAQVEAAALAAAAPFTPSVVVTRSGQNATVTVTYQFQTVVPLVNMWGGGTVPIARTMVSQ